MYSYKLPKCHHDFTHVSKLKSLSNILWFYGKYVFISCADSDPIGRHKASKWQKSKYQWFLKADITAFLFTSMITAFYDLVSPLLFCLCVICITSWPDIAIVLNDTKLLKQEFLLNGELVTNQNNPTTFPLSGSRPTS